MKNVTKEERRNFLRQTSAVMVFASPAMLLSNRVIAVHHGMVDPESPQAVALAYVKESTVEGQNCSNCALYQNGDEKVGDCPLFQGKKVAASAWCNAWVIKG